MNSENVIFVYTDGAYRLKSKIGAWAFILKYKDKYFEKTVVVENTTCNIMELTAIIEGLSELINPKLPVIISTDSQYVVNGITDWVFGWIKKDWMTSLKEPVKNKDLLSLIST